MQRFAVTAAMGILILLVLAFYVLPALLSIISGHWIDPGSGRCVIWRKSRLNLLAISLLFLSFTGLFRLRADSDTNQVFASGTDLQRANNGKRIY